MLPNQPFSANIGPPWQPACWSKSPEQLIAEAQLLNFQNRSDVEYTALQTPGDAFSGTQQAGANEAEQMINPVNPPEPQGRAAQWNANMQQLRSTEPLAGTVHGTGYSPSPGQANPPA